MPSWDIIKILRTGNTEANYLTKFTSIVVLELKAIERKVFLEFLSERITLREWHEGLALWIFLTEPCWMDPIVAYLKDGVVPAERKNARRLMY